jgi:Glycine rich protein
MAYWNLSRCGLSISIAAALLAGCSGSQLPVRANGTSATMQAQSHHRTFQYTGAEQSFKVPAGVTSLDVDARGAAGAESARYSQHAGRGGRVRATIPVQPGQTLHVFVGGVGGEGSRQTGGFNGGGSGGNWVGICKGFGGGGASDVPVEGDTLPDRILVAGGGGGFDGYGDPGGGGGGKKGGRGFPIKPYYGNGVGGGGGTQSKGGAGGAGGRYTSGSSPGSPGTSGALGVGGTGGKCGYASDYAGWAGSGGGGGYFGGGGGGGGCPDNSGGGGGGGSGYVEPSATNVHFQRGWTNATGNGVIILSW